MDKKVFRVTDLDGQILHVKASTPQEAVLIALEEGFSSPFFIDELPSKKSYLWELELIEIEEIEIIDCC